MKFKEMKTVNKILFITSIIFVIIAVFLFGFGLIARGNSDQIANKIYDPTSGYADELLSYGVSKETASLLITNTFGLVCGIAIIEGFLAYLGIRAAKTNKAKAALICFSIAALGTVLTRAMTINIVLYSISIICLVIILRDNDKEVETNEPKNN